MLGLQIDRKFTVFHINSILVNSKINLVFIGGDTMNKFTTDDIIIDENTLVVVCNDDMLLYYIDGLIVKLGLPYKIIRWDDKRWKEEKKKGNLDMKVLLLGNVKDTGSVLPLIDVKFDEKGIKCGWFGNNAVLYADPTLDKEEYEAFLLECEQASLPHRGESEKGNKALKFGKIATIILLDIPGIASTWLYSYQKDKAARRQQQLIYGISKFCSEHLEEFMSK